ncbi:MAG: hypothetical protein ABIS15_04450 [Gemmatimonadaceae bacterium]
MKDKVVPSIAWSDDLIAADDELLFAFIDNLRGSVLARVAAGQRDGESLGDIVTEVREIVRRESEAAESTGALSRQSNSGISRQALAWCIEAYEPAAPSSIN